MKQKPRVAIFDFADCEGCELEIADLEEEILDLISLVDIVSFREVMKEHSDSYDIAIVERQKSLLPLVRVLRWVG